MTSIGILQIVVFFGLILLFTKPVGLFMSRLFQGERTFLHPIFGRIEVLVYKLCGVREDDEQRWTQYAASLLSVQPLLFSVRVRLSAAAGSSAAQSAGIRHRADAAGPVVQHRDQLHDEHELAGLQRRIDDELSRADGGAGRAELRVGRARASRSPSRLIRGFARQETDRIGNFWVDLTRATLYVLMPLSIVAALVFCSQGVDPELPPIHRCEDGRGRDADDRAGSGRVAGSHQAARHERRRLLQRAIRRIRSRTRLPSRTSCRSC